MQVSGSMSRVLGKQCRQRIHTWRRRGSVSIHPPSTARDFGVTLDDQNLSFQQHFSRTCQICYLQLRRINSIRHYLSWDALKILISAFVLFRIDYWNSLLAGCPKQLIHKPQNVQNNAASLKSDNISSVLRTLHWLPVERRSEYKPLLLALKSVNNEGQSYLYDLLKFYIPSRQLRSSSDSRFFAFLHSVWNPLDNASSRIRPLFCGTLSGSHSVIPTLHLPSNLL